MALAANLLACFRLLALPEGELRDAAPKLLRYRLLHLPARMTRGQRKRWLHLRADWPWTEDVINTWRAVRALATPTCPPPEAPTIMEGPTARSVEPGVTDATVGPRPHPRTGKHDQNCECVVWGTLSVTPVKHPGWRLLLEISMMMINRITSVW